MAERERRFVVGYALAPKKENSFIQSSLLTLARDRGVDLIKIDTAKSLMEQGPFDCVLHKLYGDNWKCQLEEYGQKYPNSLIIDSPDAIARLHNRISMLQVVSELNLINVGCGDDQTTTTTTESSFGIPKQVLVYDYATMLDPCVWGEGGGGEGLCFPVIAKPLVADGSAKSHKMSLVFNNEGLNKLKPPLVLQQFVNHGGVIFKVYVVGEYVKCVKRKSLPDVSEESLRGLQGSLSFSQVSNLSENEKNDDKYYKSMNLEDAEMPPDSLICDIACGLRKAMKLHLFNFDVIRDTRVGNRYLVIDINYFPGYAKMPGYEVVLTDFFWDVLSRRRDGSFDERMEVNGEKEVRFLVCNNGCVEDEGGALPVSPLKREEKDTTIQV